MFYYKITGKIADEEFADKMKGGHSGYIERNKLSALSVELYEHSNRTRFFFVSGVSKNSIDIGLICDDNRKIEQRINEFIRKLSVEVSDVEYYEVVFKVINQMIISADRSDYVEDADEILRNFDISCMDGREYGSTNFAYMEYLIEEHSIQTTLNGTSCFMVKESLNEELERISSCSKKKYVKGHPVHYLIRSDNKEESVKIAEVLVGSLYANNRLLSRRYTTIGFKTRARCSADDFKPIYTSGKGGTVLVQVNYGNDRESNYASQGMENIEILCSMLKENANDVLTIIWIPKKSETTKKLIYERLENINIVEISDKAANLEKAKEYLKLIASEKQVRTDKKLFENLENGKYYLTSELNDMYDSWYSNKLKTVLFPQYKNISTVKCEAINDGPRGNAYDELMNMIGLEKAKEVIKQALNYSKAQKIFADKGAQFDRTSMHMIFTGNPGTAKTSVARLFAQIMKDNDVLAQGRLIECGRADLVGRYVGWTAPTIKNKFKEAEGSVLFIDEAYSLVDDRNGSYGDEAINTIVQEMENHREDVVVIFAGYPDKMEEFLNKNPGLRSRIAYHVPFDDYNVDELCSIADLISKKKGLILAEDAREKLHDVFRIALKDSDFGNGRYVRNVIEKAKMAQASRLVASDYNHINSDDVRTIVASDIEMPVTKIEKPRFGFCA